MLQHHYAKYKYNFQIDFSYAAYLYKLQSMKKKIEINGNIIRPAPLQSGYKCSKPHCILTDASSRTKLYPKSPKI